MAQSQFNEENNASPNEEEADDKSNARRSIPGNLPYTTSVGVLKRVLEKIPTSEKPSTFNYDFMTTVLDSSGGAARQALSMLKKFGFISSEGTPTDIYAQFQTEGDRASAALKALKHGFSEIFRRNQFAHRADEDKLRDIIVSITGLPKTDSILKYIQNTFQALQEYAKTAKEPREEKNKEAEDVSPELPRKSIGAEEFQSSLGLAYHFNIVLPETTNIEVFNSIFKSLKENLLK
jgi:hypothetical protein